MRLPKLLDKAVDLIRKPLIGVALVAAPFFASGQQQEPARLPPLKVTKGDTTLVINPPTHEKSDYNPQQILNDQINARKAHKNLVKHANMIQKDPYFATGLGAAEALVDIRYNKRGEPTRQMTYYREKNEMLVYKDDPRTKGTDLVKAIDMSGHYKRSLKKGQTAYSAIEYWETIAKAGHPRKLDLYAASFIANPRTQMSLDVGYNNSWSFLEVDPDVGMTPNNPVSGPYPMADKIEARDLNGAHAGISARFANPFTGLLLKPHANRFFFTELGYKYYFQEPNTWGVNGNYSYNWGPNSGARAYSRSHTPSRSRGAFGVGTPAEWPIIAAAKIGVEGIGGKNHRIQRSHGFYELEVGVQVPLNVLFMKKKEDAPLLNATILQVKATRGHVKRNEWNWGFYDFDNKETFYNGINVSLAFRPSNLLQINRKDQRKAKKHEYRQDPFMKKSKKTASLDPVKIMPQADQDAQKAYATFQEGLKDKTTRADDAFIAYAGHDAIITNEKGEKVFGYVLEPMLVVPPQSDMDANKLAFTALVQENGDSIKGNIVRATVSPESTDRAAVKRDKRSAQPAPVLA